MEAAHINTTALCTNCGRHASARGPAIIHRNDDGYFLALYCRDTECLAAETRAWEAGTQ